MREISISTRACCIVALLAVNCCHHSTVGFHLRKQRKLGVKKDHLSFQQPHQTINGLTVSKEELENDEIASRREFLAASAMLMAAVTIGVDQASAATTAENQNQKVLDKKPLILEEPTLSTASAAAATAEAPIDWSSIFSKASKKALGGGKAGASAAVVQVSSLMWLRTAMNYQYRYGGNLQSSLSTLMKEGGIGRLYQGLPFALLQGPLSRFGDTAANVGVLALLESTPGTASLPLPLRTACGSVAAGLWRIILMPIDTSKTAMQVEGKEGLELLYEKVAEEKSLGPLYQGAVASAAATAVGHYPWFLTFNFLNDALPTVEMVASGGESENMLLLISLARSAFLGLCASCVSDCCSNSLRVIKTTKQTASLSSEGELSYREALSTVLEKDGIGGLLGRGLQTRILTNAIQGAVFSVLWKFFEKIQGA